MNLIFERYLVYILRLNMQFFLDSVVKQQVENTQFTCPNKPFVCIESTHYGHHRVIDARSCRPYVG